MTRIGQSGTERPGSIGAVFGARAVMLGHRPFLTFYGDATGERTELSYATFFNWTSKAANLLVEEAELERAGTVALCVRNHWTGAVLVVAAWMVGAVVAFDTADADVLVVPEADAPGFADHAGLVTLGAGMAGRLTTEAPGIAFGDEVLAFGDDYTDPAVGPDAPAVAGATHAALLDRAQDLLRPDDRLLVAGPLEPETVTGLLVAPALAGASVVWCPTPADVDMPARIAAERVTHVLGDDGRVAPAS